MAIEEIARRDALGSTASVLSALITGCIAAPSSGGRKTTKTPANDSSKEASTAGNWPTFQSDYRRTGHAPENDGPESDAEIAWEFDTGSPTVRCSPSITDGTVYTASSGTPALLFAIDASDGTNRWGYELDEYATAAPTITGQHLLFGERGGRAYALDRETGEEVWVTDVERPVGRSSSVVRDGTVYFGTQGLEPDVVNADTDESDYSAPSVLALDATTGEEQWRYDEFSTRDSIETSLALATGTLYVASKSGVVCALDADTGEEHWQRELPGSVLSDVTVRGGTVYLGEHETGLVRAMDAETGADRWTTELAGNNVKSSPAVTDKTLYIGCYEVGACIPEGDDCGGGETGYVQAIDLAGGATEWTVEAPSDVRSSPAVVENGIYVGAGDGVVGLDFDGTRRWTVELGSSVESSPAVADGRLVVGCNDGNVYGIE